MRRFVRQSFSSPRVMSTRTVRSTLSMPLVAFSSATKPPTSPMSAKSNATTAQNQARPTSSTQSGMGSQSFVVPVGELNWEREVLQSDRPVILDVWSDRSAPCKRLSPMLEQMARNTPSVKFCSLDSDREDRLTEDLQIKVLPTMLAIFRGKLLEAPVTGLPAPEQLQQFVDRVSNAGKTMMKVEETQLQAAELLSLGEEALDANQLEAAAARFSQALKVQGAEQSGPLGGLALVAMSQGAMEEAVAMVKKIKTIKGHEQVPLAKRAVGAVELSQQLESLIVEMKDAKFEMGTKDAKFKDAVFLCASGRVDQAIDQLIDLIKLDKSFRDGPDMTSPRGLLFKIFAGLGATHPLTIQGRKKLSLALFM